LRRRPRVGDDVERGRDGPLLAAVLVSVTTSSAGETDLSRRAGSPSGRSRAAFSARAGSVARPRRRAAASEAAFLMAAQGC
jgi:hypothetical protein